MESLHGSVTGSCILTLLFNLLMTFKALFVYVEILQAQNAVLVWSIDVVQQLQFF